MIRFGDGSLLTTKSAGAAMPAADVRCEIVMRNFDWNFEERERETETDKDIMRLKEAGGKREEARVPLICDSGNSRTRDS